MSLIVFKADLLSIKIIVGPSSSNFESSRIDLIYLTAIAKSYAAINSASAELHVVSDWVLDL